MILDAAKSDFKRKRDRGRAFRDSLFFRVVCALLFGAAMFDLIPDKAIGTFLALIGISCSFFPGLAIEILAIGSLSVLLLFPGPFLLGDHSGGGPAEDFSVGAAYVFGLALAFGAAWLILSPRSGWVRRNPVLAALLVTLALVAAVAGLGTGSGPASLVALVTLFAWSRFLLPTLFVRRTGLAARGLKWSSLWLVFPIWNRVVIPQWDVRALPDLKERMASASRLRPRLALLCALYLVAIFLDRKLRLYLRWDLGARNFQIEGIVPFLQTGPSFALAWARVLLSTLELIVFYFGFGTSILVALQWMAGIYSPSNLQYPHRSRSFHEFFGRIMFYYSRTVQVVGIYPLMSHIKVFRNHPRLRVFAVTFLGVFLISLVDHVCSDSGPALSAGLPWGALAFWAQAHGVYAVLLSMAVAASAAFGSRLSGRLPMGWHAVRVFVIFLVYSVISLTGNYSLETLGAKLALFRYLFTGSV